MSEEVLSCSTLQCPSPSLTFSPSSWSRDWNRVSAATYKQDLPWFGGPRGGRHDGRPDNAKRANPDPPRDALPGGRDAADVIAGAHDLAGACTDESRRKVDEAEQRRSWRAAQPGLLAKGCEGDLGSVAVVKPRSTRTAGSFDRPDGCPSAASSRPKGALTRGWSVGESSPAAGERCCGQQTRTNAGHDEVHDDGQAVVERNRALVA